MRRNRGKHAKAEKNILLTFAIVLIALLFLVQIVMLNEQIRNKLSIVDFLEGQSIGTEFK